MGDDGGGQDGQCSDVHVSRFGDVDEGGVVRHGGEGGTEVRRGLEEDAVGGEVMARVVDVGVHHVISRGLDWRSERCFVWVFVRRSCAVQTGVTGISFLLFVGSKASAQALLPLVSCLSYVWKEDKRSET